MKVIDVIRFVYIYGGFDVIRFVYIYGGYRYNSFCLHLCGILTYFRLFTFMWDIDVFSFVYIYVGY